MHPQSAAFERASPFTVPPPPLALRRQPGLSGPERDPDLPALLARYGRRLEHPGHPALPLLCARPPVAARWSSPGAAAQALAGPGGRACCATGPGRRHFWREQLELLGPALSRRGPPRDRLLPGPSPGRCAGLLAKGRVLPHERIPGRSTATWLCQGLLWPDSTGAGTGCAGLAGRDASSLELRCKHSERRLHKDTLTSKGGRF